MGDILKEAIADAKAVRETALLNAKMALEEAFTPQLKNMLSAKLREDEFEDEEEMGGEEEFGDEEEEEIPAEEGYYEDEESEEVPGEEEFGDEEGGGEGGEEEFDDEEDFEEGLELEDVIRELEAELSEEPEAEEPVVDETIEVNGVRYAPIQEEEDIEEGASDNPTGQADPDGPDNPAGEGREMKESTDEDVEIDESLFTETEDEDEDKEEVDEQSSSSGIGKGTGVKAASASDEEDPGKSKDTPGKAQAMESVQAELTEYKEAVSFLKDKLHEVNILNAKLLFTNKLFKEFALDNNQKLKVVETFDRTQSNLPKHHEK